MNSVAEHTGFFRGFSFSAALSVAKRILRKDHVRKPPLLYLHVLAL